MVLCHLKRVNAHAIGVNYLLQFLLLFRSIPQLSENKNQKWTFFVMSLCLLCFHTLLFFRFYYVSGNHTKRNPSANILNFIDIKVRVKELFARSRIFLFCMPINK